MFWFKLLVCVCTVKVVQSYSFYRDRIPNGYNVTQPCDVTLTWNGVGHENNAGGGARNPFGVAFAANDRTWTKELCQADSDGDGQTNGEELGDPDCTWTPGSIPKLSPAPSHPGVCEPVDSTVCKEKNSFLDCGTMGFDCPSISEPGVVEIVMKLNEKTKVPNKETTYICQGMNFPTDQEYHMIASTPVIDNVDVAHHIVIYGCPDYVQLTVNQTSQASECFMGSGHGCNDVIAIWTLGSDGFCYHRDVGIPIGASGYKQAILEVHWNNPELIDNYYDNSGLTVYLTPNKRMYEGATLSIGEEGLIIPPQETQVTKYGGCSGDCTRELMSEPIHIVAVLNHMHFLGRAALTEVVRVNGMKEDIARDDTFDYNTPVFHSIDNPIQINPGDALKIRCEFSSLSRNKTTFFGPGTQDEMCYGVIMYYPRGSLSSQYCTSFGEYDSCDERNTQDTLYGCEAAYRQPNSPEMKALVARVTENCTPGLCLKECLPVVKEIYSNPCFNGSLRTRSMIGFRRLTNTDYLLQLHGFWHRVDSCLPELQGCRNVTWSMTSTSASETSLVSATILLSLLAAML